MTESTMVVGCDVHKEKITAAVLPSEAARPTEIVTIENNPKAIARFVKRLAHRGLPVFVYEAGPCGYEVQRQITQLGHQAVVIAPALVPRRPGDRVKTNRRDAEKLARLYRAGELTEIRVPTRLEEAARDLVRVREDALKDRLRARHRLSKFLLRQGRIYPEKTPWGARHRAWLHAQRFELPLLQSTFNAYMHALEDVESRLESLDQQVLTLAQAEPYRVPVQYIRCLKGLDTLSALTLQVETQDFWRFEEAPAYMNFTGLVCSEDSSGEDEHRGPITKAGNAHLRRILVEAAWSYRHRNTTSPALAKRRRDCPPEVIPHRPTRARAVTLEILAARQPGEIESSSRGRGGTRAGGVCLGDRPAVPATDVGVSRRGKEHLAQSVLDLEARPRYGASSALLCGAHAQACADPRP